MNPNTNKLGELKLKNWKPSNPLRPRFGNEEWGCDTQLELCQSFLPRISDALTHIENELFDISLVAGAVELTDFFLKKIIVAMAVPDSTVEVNGEALQLLGTILKNVFRLVLRFKERPKYSLSSRTRRYVLTLSTILLRQESRGAGEKNESPWSQAEKRESNNTFLDEITIPEARQMWTKIQCTDLALVPWDHFFKLFEKTLSMTISPQDEAILKKLMTKTGVDYVRPSEFCNFLKAFDGNFSQTCVQNAKQMWFSSGFYPWCSFVDALKFLRFEDPGSYVITLSSRKNCFFECHVVTGPGEVSNWLLRVDMPNGYYASPAGKPTDEQFYKNLTAFLHQVNATSPFISDSLSEEGFHGDLTSDEIVELLADVPDGTYIVSYDATKIADEDTSSAIKNFLLVSYKCRDRLFHLNIEKSKLGFRFVESRRKGRANSSKSLKADLSREYQPSLGSLLQTRRDILKYNFSFDNIPNFSILPYLNTAVTIDFVGPEKEKEGVILSYRSNICAETMGGYPSASLGAILCDRFHVRCLGDRTIFALADGCNWGPRARNAATKAALGFIEYMSDLKIQSESTTLATLKDHTLRSFRIAHAKIIGETPIDEIWTIGQTTLLCGIMVPLLNNKAYRWGVLFFSVGDCKLFLFNESTGVRDLTYGNRANARNAKDTGGRLGPYVDGGQPDLRNLKSFFWPLKTGETFFAVSDGVYDNFDPETLGYSPEQLKLPYASWDDIPPDDCLAIKDMFTIQRMNDIIYNVKQRKPYQLARTFIRYGMDTTSKSREFMEQNPNTAEPEDHKLFPGKMDHITAIVIRAGAMLEEDPKKQSAKEKKKSIKDMKTKETLLRKAREKPDDFVLYIKKNLKSNVPKVSLYSKSPKASGPAGSDPEEENKKYFMKSSLKLGQMCNSTIFNAAGMTFSTIPDDKQPCSEYFLVDYTTRRTITVFSSASTYGPAETPLKPADAFLNYFLRNIEVMKDFQDLPDIFADGFDHAHKTLITQPLYLSENTTLTACLSIKNPDEYALKTGKTWSSIVCNVGASKVFYWDYLRFALTELTESVSYDPSCLGPLGASDETPNYTQLSVFYQLCDPRGIILVLSPGVCAALDPYNLGVKAEDHSTTCEEIEEATKTWRIAKMTKLLKKARPSCVSDHVSVILEYVLKIAQNYLDFDETDETQDAPGAFFGHASVVAFRVGPFQEEPGEERKTKLSEYPLKFTKSPRGLDKRQSEKSRSATELRRLRLERDALRDESTPKSLTSRTEKRKVEVDPERPHTDRTELDKKKKQPKKGNVETN